MNAFVIVILGSIGPRKVVMRMKSDCSTRKMEAWKF